MTAKGIALAWIAIGLTAACGSVSEGDGNGNGDVDAASPDGAPPGCQPSIVFSQNGDLMRIERDGSGLVNLTNSSDAVQDEPRFSPNGLRMAYLNLDAGGISTAVVADADGSNPVPVSLEPMDDVAEVEWLTNERLVFLNALNATEANIVAVNGDGSQRRGVRASVRTSGDLRASQVTSRIAYTPLDANRILAMATIGFDGTDDSVLALDGARPTFSPDGTQLAFAFSNNIGIVNVDGSGQTILTADSAEIDIAPFWSSDGAQIYFLRKTAFGSPNDLFVTNADGTGQTNLTSSAKDEVAPIAVSPDGQAIAITNGALVVIEVNGGEVTELPGTAGATNPAWLACAAGTG